MADHALFAAWPVTDDSYDRADLIAEAYEHLLTVADEAGAEIAGPARWELVDAADLAGWEWWDGRLLIAAAPARPAVTALVAA